MTRLFPTEEIINLEPHPSSFPTVRYKSTIVRENLSNSLYTKIADDLLEESWIDKERYNREDKDTIDWATQSKALKASPLKTRRFICKWASNTISTGRNMVKWKLRYKGSCPFCNTDNEDKNHILRCENSEAQKIWKEGLADLVSSMKKWKTDPTLAKTIEQELHQWHQYNSNHIDLYPARLKKAILSQRNLGWKNFLEGLISKEIIEIQSKYYTNRGLKYTGTGWAKKLIKGNWSLLRHSWDKRNNKLHSPEIIQKLEGFEELQKAIQAEWQLGLHNLPGMEFEHLFNKHHTPEKIGRSIEQMKSWFSTIRGGRILYKDTLIPDKFSEKGPLQRWVGLSDELFPSKREAKARKTLQLAIKKEIQQGLGNLPAQSYTQFFRKTYKQIIEQTTQSQKDWFATVRKARFLHDKENANQDEFSKTGFHQRWVGLDHSLYY